MHLNEPFKKFVCSFNCCIDGFSVGDPLRNTLDYAGDDPVDLAFIVVSALKQYSEFDKVEYKVVLTPYIHHIYAFIEEDSFEGKSKVAIVTSMKEFLMGR